MSASANILVVVDDPAFRSGLMVALRERGFHVVLHGDPEQALLFLATNPADLVIVDSRLRGTDGLSWVRDRRAEGNVVPMLLCASNREEAQALLDAAGALQVWSILPKAAPPEALADHVQELLRPVPAPTPADSMLPVAEALETLRLSNVDLQKDPESIDRMHHTSRAARALREVGGALGLEEAVDAAKRFEAVIAEALEGRRRLDGDAWMVFERAMGRTREALASAGVAAPASTPPPAPRRPSASAYAAAPEGAGEPGPRTSAPPGVDELTGLLLRDAFLRDATECVEGAMIDERPLSFCVIGVDGSDALRAARALDPVLERIGGFLAGRFRPEDVRGRWSIDTFAIALPGMPAAMAVTTMTRTLEAFAQGGPAPPLSAGVGVYPKDGPDAEAVLRMAEMRMEAARRATTGPKVRG